MTTINVPGMHCPKCVERIGNALDAAAVKCEISLDNKTVAVDDANVAKTIEILDDLGFDAEV